MFKKGNTLVDSPQRAERPGQAWRYVLRWWASGSCCRPSLSSCSRSTVCPRARQTPATSRLASRLVILIKWQVIHKSHWYYLQELSVLHIFKNGLVPKYRLTVVWNPTYQHKSVSWRWRARRRSTRWCSGQTPRTAHPVTGPSGSVGSPAHKHGRYKRRKFDMLKSDSVIQCYVQFHKTSITFPFCAFLLFVL